MGLVRPWHNYCGESNNLNSLKMKKFLLLFCLFTGMNLYAQVFTWSPDSISLADPDYPMARYHDVLRYHSPLMYLAFPVIKPVVNRRIPLENGEGKNGYW